MCHILINFFALLIYVSNIEKIEQYMYIQDTKS